MRPITNQTEEEFLEDKALHKWWNGIVTDERFHRILDSVNRKIDITRRLVLEDQGVDCAYGFKYGSEEFQERLEGICLGRTVPKEEMEFTLGEEPDFEEKE